MHRIYTLAIGSALLAIAAKMASFLFLPPDEDTDLYVRFLYLLVFLIALFFGIRFDKQTHPGSAITDDIKAGMKITSVFALILSAFTWVYYKLINPGYFVSKIERTVDAAASNPEAKIEKVRETAEFIFNPFIHTTITLFGFMVLGFIYSLVIVLLLRSTAGRFMTAR